MRKIFVLFLFLTFFGGVELAQAQEGSAAKPFLHPLFSDDMVLQREVKFPVWGWTTPGASVTVQLRGQKATATADADGKWLARLGPFEAGGPYTLTISGPQSVTLNNVLVGDVWLCSGQSNMEMGVTQVDNAKEEVAQANYPRVRLFAVPKTIAAAPQGTVNARWLVTTPANITTGGWGGFSAVAYFFGRHLHKELNVPIGLIHSSWGGTVAEGWVSAEALSAMAEFQPAIKSLAETMTAPAKAAVDVDRTTEAWWPKNDPGSSATPPWSDPALDVSQWQTMRLPQFWEDAGLADYDGVAWFRRTFELPADWSGRDLVLSLGPIDDRDTTFVNGVRVGAMSQYDAPRSYKVPASIVKPGVNTIAVRVLDTGVGGGIYGSPEQMKIVPADGSGAAVSLAGEWSYRPSVKLGEVKEAPPTQPASGNLGLVNARYNGMIAPLLPFAIKGAIWYQGESNVGRAAQYERLLPVMIRDWRARFQSGDFPFLIVQLANYLGRKTVPGDSEWARLREAQLKISQAVPRAGLAVAIDIGDAKDIHPKNKQEVGRRLALAALEIAYGKKGASSGPVYRSMKEDGGVIRLSFDHADGGLVIKPGAEGLSGFAIAGEDRRFVWADAVVHGKEVWVSSPSVKFPIAVRYGWADNPVSTLYNGAGLPASPFRTDDFKAGSAGPAGN
ncbi:MAG TPA: sialate O-acetylesterase [Pyrinomonadaceae bacterium]|nr:sialate O-acetylesterase [Pyrinomonadaceae bacterium]